MKTINLDENAYQYVLEHTPTDDILKQLIQETKARADHGMQISPDQGAFMKMLVKLMNVKNAIEIGCYTGYSAISIASGLPLGGKLISIDLNSETTSIAQKYIKMAQLEDKVDLRIGKAEDLLPVIKIENGYENFDFAFVDADKENLLNYYEHCLDLVRRGGLILIDNVLWSGKVLDLEDTSSSTAAIRQFNDKVLSDNRVEKVMLHVADGLYLLRKK